MNPTSATPKSSKNLALAAALNQIENQFGKGAVVSEIIDDSKSLNVISTGSTLLDSATGIGGIPHSRIVEIFGTEGGGKTTMALEIIASAQREGKVCAFIDAEHSLDPQYAKSVGVDINNLYLFQPDSCEDGLAVMEIMANSGAFDIVALDTLAALTPKAELMGEVGEHFAGLQARILSKYLRSLSEIQKKSSNACTCIFVNQIRIRLNRVIGNKEVTPGGDSLKFYAALRFDIRKINTIESNHKAVGITSRVKVVKNKLATAFKQVDIQIHFGKGFNDSSSLLAQCMNHRVIDLSGSWVMYKGKRLGKGIEESAMLLNQQIDLKRELEKLLISVLNKD